MAINVQIIVEEVNTLLDTYDEIQLVSASTPNGSYSEVDTAALVEDQFAYEIEDSSGLSTTWYKYRFQDTSESPATAYTNPFQAEVVDRIKLRQKALETYRCGLVLATSSSDGGSTTTIITTDYRFATSFWAGDKAVGTIVLPMAGAEVGNARRVSASAPSTGTLTVHPAWSTGPGESEAFEWYWLGTPEIWNLAINEALSRYYYIDRAPIAPVASSYEYSMEEVPWLIEKNQVTGLWFKQVNDHRARPYAQGGRWYGLYEDEGVVKVEISNPFNLTDLVYLEAIRPIPPLYTDASTIPSGKSLDLCAALVYDEVLKYLSNPGEHMGAADRASILTARAMLQPKLKRLLRRHRPRPRWALPIHTQPPIAPHPYSAR